MAGLFGLFDYNKEGKGVYPDDPPKGPIANFFAILGRKFWKIIQINLMYLLFSLPAIIVSVLAATFAVNWLFPKLTIDTVAKLLTTASITPAEGYSIEQYASSQLIIVYLILGLLLFGLSLIIAGPVHAGFTYVLRNFSREEHAFIWMDFKEHFVKNLKQSLLAALISFVVTVLLIFNIAFYMNSIDLNLGIFRPLLMSMITVVLVIWCIMQMYLYPMMVTFNLSLKQMYKNCLLFSILRLPVNLAVLAVSLILTVGLPLVLMMLGNGITLFIAIIYYLLLAFGLNLFLTNYFIYRGLDKYMIQRIKASEEMNSEDEAESPAEREAADAQAEGDSGDEMPENGSGGQLQEAPAGAKT